MWSYLRQSRKSDSGKTNIKLFLFFFETSRNIALSEIEIDVFIKAKLTIQSEFIILQEQIKGQIKQDLISRSLSKSQSGT